MYGITNSSFDSRATCDDVVTGSTTVFVNDGGVSRVILDSTTTGGTILGPGSVYVKCEDKSISVKGDAVATHPPCVIPPTHCAAFTGGSSDVFTGGLFAPAGASVAGGPQFADLSVPSLTITIPLGGSLATVGIGWPGPLKFRYEISNTGTIATSPFTIALYEVLGLPTVPPPPPPLPLGITITRGTPNILENVVFIEEKRITQVIHPGDRIVDTWTLDFGDPFAVIPANYVRYYVLAVDIDGEVSELKEWDNASPLVTMVTTS